MRACQLHYAFSGLVHHVLKGVWGPDLILRPLCRLLLPTASRSPLFLLMLHYCYLPIAILGIRLLILPLVKTCVVVVEIGVVVVVAKVVVPLDLAPLAPIGTIRPICFCCCWPDGCPWMKPLGLNVIGRIAESDAANELAILIRSAKEVISLRRSLSFNKDPSKQPSVKYWMAWIS